MLHGPQPNGILFPCKPMKLFKQASYIRSQGHPALGYYESLLPIEYTGLLYSLVQLPYDPV